MKYIASPFKVQLIWCDGGGIKKRTFKKYLDALDWANKNLTADEVFFKISGKAVRSINE